ncbi:MAG: hypothetical protein SCALA702_21060 [Melioribacteraceae bacterium]|nr:MAG: hypothetical protein SCALA702_21060 [Melioribacteraceae bacterium]
MKKVIFNIMLVIFFASAVTLSAQKDYKSKPGYFNFEKFASHSEDDLMTEVFLESKLLKMAAKVTGEKEQDLSDVIAGLELISVRIYSVKADDTKGYYGKIESMDKDLKSNDWDRIVMTRDDGDYANVYVKTKDDLIVGLVVVAMDDASGSNEGEIVYVNIVGDIDLSKIGKLSSRFDIPNLDKVDRRHDNHEYKDEK